MGKKQHDECVNFRRFWRTDHSLNCIYRRGVVKIGSIHAARAALCVVGGSGGGGGNAHGRYSSSTSSGSHPASTQHSCWSCTAVTQSRVHQQQTEGAFFKNQNTRQNRSTASNKKQKKLKSLEILDVKSLQWWDASCVCQGNEYLDVIIVIHCKSTTQKLKYYISRKIDQNKATCIFFFLTPQRKKRKGWGQQLLINKDCSLQDILMLSE